MSDREALILDAAIDVLAHGGTRRLTHRAVDTHAHLPAGSTSNRFRNRDALLAGVLRRLLERELALWTRKPVGLNTRSIDEFADRLGRMLEAISDTEPELTLARHALFTDASQQPALRIELHAARKQLDEWLTPAIADLGSTSPTRHLRHLLALMDGLLTSQMIDPAPDFTPAEPIAALLHGLLTPQPQPN